MQPILADFCNFRHFLSIFTDFTVLDQIWGHFEPVLEVIFLEVHFSHIPGLLFFWPCTVTMGKCRGFASGVWPSKSFMTVFLIYRGFSFLTNLDLFRQVLEAILNQFLGSFRHEANFSHIPGLLFFWPCTVTIGKCRGFASGVLDTRILRNSRFFSYTGALLFWPIRTYLGRFWSVIWPSTMVIFI